MCNTGLKEQALFLQKSGEKKKRGRNTTLRGTNISQIPVEAIPPAWYHGALHSWGGRRGLEDWSLLHGDAGCITAPGSHKSSSLPLFLTLHHLSSKAPLLAKVVIRSSAGSAFVIENPSYLAWEPAALEPGFWQEITMTPASPKART